MRKSIFVILIFMFNGALGYQATAQRKANGPIEIFDLMFLSENFDSKYCRKESGQWVFPVLQEGVILSFLDSLNLTSDLVQLKNGNQIALNTKGWMFMAEIKHYLKINKIEMSGSECLVEIECIEFNGFIEKGLGHGKFLFVRDNDIWKVK